MLPVKQRESHRVSSEEISFRITARVNSLIDLYSLLSFYSAKRKADILQSILSRFNITYLLHSLKTAHQNFKYDIPISIVDWNRMFRCRRFAAWMFAAGRFWRRFFVVGRFLQTSRRHDFFSELFLLTWHYSTSYLAYYIIV